MGVALLCIIVDELVTIIGIPIVYVCMLNFNDIPIIKHNFIIKHENESERKRSPAYITKRYGILIKLLNFNYNFIFSITVYTVSW